MKNKDPLINWRLIKGLSAETDNDFFCLSLFFFFFDEWKKWSFWCVLIESLFSFLFFTFLFAMDIAVIIKNIFTQMLKVIKVG